MGRLPTPCRRRRSRPSVSRSAGREAPTARDRPSADGSIDAAGRRATVSPVSPAAQRRVLTALRRLHRREPLKPDLRLDALLAEVRTAPASRSARHRGAQPVALGHAELLAVIDRLEEEGRVVRHGRRVRLLEHQPTLEPVMRGRVDQLLAGLREAGVDVPRLDGIAARLGIPDGVVAQLRASGELVAVAPGIDYPRETWATLAERVDRIAARGPLTVGRVRGQLHCSRRHAGAILAFRRAERQRLRRRRPDA